MSAKHIHYMAPQENKLAVCGLPMQLGARVTRHESEASCGACTTWIRQRMLGERRAAPPPVPALAAIPAPEPAPPAPRTGGSPEEVLAALRTTRARHKTTSEEARALMEKYRAKNGEAEELKAEIKRLEEALLHATRMENGAAVADPEDDEDARDRRFVGRA